MGRVLDDKLKGTIFEAKVGPTVKYDVHFEPDPCPCLDDGDCQLRQLTILTPVNPRKIRAMD